MRVLQIIDSLDIGGAEKMAVNYANALSERLEFSGLVATRKEGNLKLQLHSNVSYLFLNRKNTIDLKAIFILKKYCKENKITHLQPHSRSFFTALLVKFIHFKLQIIWHDHYGLSEFLNIRKSLSLKFASYFFKGIITVNYQLKNWAIKELHCNKVVYLPNFTTIDNSIVASTKLKGIEGKRILCLANLRVQKNHFFLLKIAKKLRESHPDWTFHLVGKDFQDDYSKKLIETILIEKLENTVFIYGSKDDTTNIINQSDICVFTSSSEGLPVALVEFGLVGKAVVSTKVGEIPLIIENNKNGILVEVNAIQSFVIALIKLIDNENSRIDYGINLKNTIIKNNSKEAVVEKYLNWLNSL
jgi:glycosyltransferase involved in cell wall biosynthesis